MVELVKELAERKKKAEQATEKLTEAPQGIRELLEQTKIDIEDYKSKEDCEVFKAFLGDRGLNPVLNMNILAQDTLFYLENQTVDDYSCSGYWFAPNLNSILWFAEGDIKVKIFKNKELYNQYVKEVLSNG